MKGKYEPSKKTFKFDERDNYCQFCQKTILGDRKDVRIEKFEILRRFYKIEIFRNSEIPQERKKTKNREFIEN